MMSMIANVPVASATSVFSQMTYVSVPAAATAAQNQLVHSISPASVASAATVTQKGGAMAVKVAQMLGLIPRVVLPDLSRTEMLARLMVSNALFDMPFGPQGLTLDEQHLSFRMAAASFAEGPQDQNRLPLAAHVSRLFKMVELQHVQIMPLFDAQMRKFRQLVETEKPHLMGSSLLDDSAQVLAHYFDSMVPAHHQTSARFYRNMAELHQSAMISLARKEQTHELVVQSCRVLLQHDFSDLASLEQRMQTLLDSVRGRMQAKLSPAWAADPLKAEAVEVDEREKCVLQIVALRLTMSQHRLRDLRNALKFAPPRTMKDLRAVYANPELCNQERVNMESRAVGRLARLQMPFDIFAGDYDDELELHEAAACKRNLFGEAFASMSIPEQVKVQVQLSAEQCEADYLKLKLRRSQLMPCMPPKFNRATARIVTGVCRRKVAAPFVKSLSPISEVNQMVQSALPPSSAILKTSASSASVSASKSASIATVGSVPVECVNLGELVYSISKLQVNSPTSASLISAASPRISASFSQGPATLPASTSVIVNAATPIVIVSSSNFISQSSAAARTSINKVNAVNPAQSNKTSWFSSSVNGAINMIRNITSSSTAVSKPVKSIASKPKPTLAFGSTRSRFL